MVYALIVYFPFIATIRTKCVCPLILFIMQSFDKSNYKFCMVLLDVEGNVIDSEPFKTLHSASQFVQNLLSRSDYRQIYSVSLFINHNLI